eukprot:206355_1
MSTTVTLILLCTIVYASVQDCSIENACPSAQKECILKCPGYGVIDLNHYVSYSPGARSSPLGKEVKGDAGNNGFMFGCTNVKLVNKKDITATCGTEDPDGPVVSATLSDIVTLVKYKGKWSSHVDGLNYIDPKQIAQPETLTIIVSQWMMYAFVIFVALVIVLTMYNIWIFFQQKSVDVVDYHM